MRVWISKRRVTSDVAWGNALWFEFDGGVACVSNSGEVSVRTDPLVVRQVLADLRKAADDGLWEELPRGAPT